ncbi:MAG: tRNA (N(6)-L-threonylcarbamoyladenosine(37)-C(2))-methylthiotransferase MtaB [Verrucomicrobiota bacterium]
MKSGLDRLAIRGQRSDMAGKRAAFQTIGCRLNQAETAVLREMFVEAGYEIVPFGTPADVVVINTCTVTLESESKCRQAIRKAVRTSPEARVGVVGCYVQVAPELLASIPGVEIVAGTEHKFDVFSHLTGPRPERPTVLHTRRISRELFSIPVTGDFQDVTRANVKVQDGCGFVCSFCIIPRARGGPRSRRFEDILRESRALIEHGHRELVLTGVNIGTYWDGERDFLAVVRAVSELDGLARLRISSIEPTTVADGVLELMHASPRLCRYLHLPLQSGSDGVLQRMRRKYTASEYRRFVERFAELAPEGGLGTDVMVGFPGETAKEHGETVALLKDLPFTYLHVFPFSLRPGTAAERAGDLLPKAVIQERSQELRELSARFRERFAKAQRGMVRRVVWESRDEGGRWQGWTDEYVRVVRATAAGGETLPVERVRMGDYNGRLVEVSPFGASADLVSERKESGH